MSGKHVFFYHPQCGHSSKLLSKVKDTPLQGDFLYINILTAKKLPSTLKGVPAILPAYQPETSILQGQHAFTWIDSALTSARMGGRPVMRSHPEPHGAQNPRSTEPVPDETGHVPIVISGNSTAPSAATEGMAQKEPLKEFIGISPFEMGGRGYSDQ